MSRTASKEKNGKIAKLIEKYRPIRQDLKEKLRQYYKQIETAEGKAYEELLSLIEIAQTKLDKLNRYGSPKRFRNRCKLTGRPRAYTRLVGVCRNEFRRLLMSGKVPGFKKASWG